MHSPEWRPSVRGLVRFPVRTVKNYKRKLGKKKLKKGSDQYVHVINVPIVNRRDGLETH